MNDAVRKAIVLSQVQTSVCIALGALRQAEKLVVTRRLPLLAEPVGVAVTACMNARNQLEQQLCAMIREGQ